MEKVEMTRAEELKAEKDFHKSRLMWLRVNGKLEWIQYSDLSHEEWFHSLHCGEDIDFEDIDRGYIKLDKETNICNIMMYKGKNFRCVQMDELLKNGKSCPDDLKLLAILYAEHKGCKAKFKVCNGVKVGEIGKPWNPLKVLEIFSVNHGKDSVRNNISLKQVLNYEDALVRLQDSCMGQVSSVGNAKTCDREDFIFDEIKRTREFFKNVLDGNCYDKLSGLAERIAMTQHMVI